jgi:hypothetical protein
MKINNKFKVGDKVFYFENNKSQSGEIAMITIWVTSARISILYKLGGGCMDGQGLEYYENRIHKTKEELLKTL